MSTDTPPPPILVVDPYPVNPVPASSWCSTVTDHDGMTETFHVLINIIIVIIIILELIFNIILIIRELLTRRKDFLSRVKMFMIPLIITDALLGCTFVPLFVLELTKNSIDVNCNFIVWRKVSFGYFLITRVLALIFICYKTRLQVNRPRSSPHHTKNDHNFTFVINISLLWSPGIASIFAGGVSSMKSNIPLLSLTIIYFVITMGSTCFCYIMVIKAINRNKKTEDGITFTDTPYYRQARNTAVKAFTCFLFINVPLILAMAAYMCVFHDNKLNHQSVYLVQLALVAIQSIANPILFIKRLTMVKKGIYKICCIIIFWKEIRYRESIMLRIEDTKNPLGPQTRTRAAAARAASVRRGLGGVDASDGGVFGNISQAEIDYYDGCIGFDESESSGSSVVGGGDEVEGDAGVDGAGVTSTSINDTPEDESNMNDNPEPSTVSNNLLN